MIERLLGDAEIVDAARRLRREDEVAEALARVAWSVVAEPGDAVAGTLIGELGAVDALAVAVGGSRQGAFALLDVAGTGQRALSEARKRWMPRADPRAVRDALRGAHDIDATLLLPGDACWPASLDDLGANAPTALWVRGRAELLVAEPRASLVGARASSGYGEHVAAELAGDLAATGTVIVSGGAYGIDGAAHRAALGVSGATVAFLAGGVDRAYPAGHQHLIGQIAARGAVVSEPPCGAAPTKWRFLARNRLIAALGHATVVIEAGWRSGSLNTAGHAAALGRPLGAVPGPVTSAASAGCHRLLREYDAQCVTSAAEVRELWGMGVGTSSHVLAVDPDRIRLLDAMSTRARVSVDELVRRSGLPPDRVRALLGLLELEEEVRRDDRGWRRLPATAPA
ncbi:DNA-processing protein DprA [Microbacterium sp. TPD7012]|uniref:DNA-processing protein DprA n=1 Tax=Microbacterium sp. TPD7012 TaxID=2171975 RepID=UPI000D51587A|nr:DNA-processing protein DprA [Microbacterium sp. TPD7012]PVE95776.1 DNA-protecting protein DprA [Microbacterium sp. TPD7012]